jgi:hypothetical protein
MLESPEVESFSAVDIVRSYVQHNKDDGFRLSTGGGGVKVGLYRLYRIACC